MTLLCLVSALLAIGAYFLTRGLRPWLRITIALVVFIVLAVLPTVLLLISRRPSAAGGTDGHAGGLGPGGVGNVGRESVAPPDLGCYEDRANERVNAVVPYPAPRFSASRTPRSRSRFKETSVFLAFTDCVLTRRRRDGG